MFKIIQGQEAVARITNYTQMKRRTFLIQSTILSTVCYAANTISVYGTNKLDPKKIRFDANLYKLFKNPESRYRPFVRWWWNGDKVEAKELIREMYLLKASGIGGVEINPISFPSTGEDLGKKSLIWLSDEWIDMLQVTFEEAKKLDMTCDLIVGSGWPFGSENLQGEERAQVVIINAEKLEGPIVYESSQFNIFKNIDPGVTEPNPSRTFEILSLKMVPDPMSGLDQVIELSDKRKEEIIREDESEIFFFANAHMQKAHKTRVTFSKEITNSLHCWIWDAECLPTSIWVKYGAFPNCL